jgi:hypothetical protein
VTVASRVRVHQRNEPIACDQPAHMDGVGRAGTFVMFLPVLGTIAVVGVIAALAVRVEKSKRRDR